MSSDARPVGRVESQDLHAGPRPDFFAVHVLDVRGRDETGRVRHHQKRGFSALTFIPISCALLTTPRKMFWLPTALFCLTPPGAGRAVSKFSFSMVIPSSTYFRERGMVCLHFAEVLGFGSWGTGTHPSRRVVWLPGSKLKPGNFTGEMASPWVMSRGRVEARPYPGPTGHVKAAGFWK